MVKRDHTPTSTQQTGFRPLAGKYLSGLCGRSRKHELDSLPKSYNVTPSPRHLPKDHIKNGGKIVHIIRNPKDVALAAFHHYKQDRFASEVLGVSKDLSAFLDLFLKGGTCTTTTKITFSVAAYGN